MAYVSRMIAHGENLIGVSRLHWIYLVQGLFWLIAMMAIGFTLDALIAMALGAVLPAVRWDLALMGAQTTWLELFFLGAGVYLFAIHFIKAATTELALTNIRVIYKTGWIAVDIQEVNLDEVRGAHLDLGMLGRIFGYGRLSFDARFVGDMQTGFINNPYRFVRAMTEAQEHLDSNISLVINDSKTGKARFKRPKGKGKTNPAVHDPQVARRVLRGETVTIPAADPRAQNTEESDRPQARAHEVAEGSYEQEKLSEEIRQEWTENADESAAQNDPYAYRTSRQIH